MKFKDLLKKYYPFLIILFFNNILSILFPSNARILIPIVIVILNLITYYLISKIQNIFNRIISYIWFLFFFLGVLNINSIKQNTDIWRLDIYEPSLLYFSCLIVFIISLIFFEKFKKKKVVFRNDLGLINKSLFTYVILFFPFLLIIDIYRTLGFFPLLTGQSFVGEMYEYNYGFLYKFKFICVYSFCIAFFMLRKANKYFLSFIYLIFLLFVVSVDGKRFVLLMGIISLIPLLLILKKKYVEKGFDIKKFNSTPVIVLFCIVGFVYIFVNVLRTGGNLKDSVNQLIFNIPFGVEYKDYVHTYNTYLSQSIKGYNFEMSALGSFFNSSFLELFQFDKNQLYNLGSQNAFMNLYNEDFGIRIGIIAELYFAYGLFVIPLMILIAFFTNRISQRLIDPKSYFNLIQNSILFALFILLINGQATVFFGNLTLIIYMYLFYLFCKLIKYKNFNKYDS